MSKSMSSTKNKKKKLQTLTQIYNKGSMANSRSGDKFRQFEDNLLFQVFYGEHKNVIGAAATVGCLIS